MIHLSQEVRRFNVLPTTVLISDPLPWLPAIVEVEHRSNRIYPNAIDVVAIEPEQRVCH